VSSIAFIVTDRTEETTPESANINKMTAVIWFHVTSSWLRRLIEVGDSDVIVINFSDLEFELKFIKDFVNFTSPHFPWRGKFIYQSFLLPHIHAFMHSSIRTFTLSHINTFTH
jgi:hypothetical protein